MQVRIYRNLNLNSYSVQVKNDGRGWRVAGHADYIKLNNVTFKVYERARQRVIASKRKNVHAFVIGELDTPEDVRYSVDGLEKIGYNPYHAGYFFRCINNERIDVAETVYLTPLGVYKNKGRA